MLSLDTWLVMAIFLAILVEIFLNWLWQREARKWHQEEMAQWQRENQGKKEDK